MSSKKIRISGITLFILFALALAGCSGQNPTTAAPAAQADGTDQIPAVRSSNSVIAEGKVVPADDAILGFSTAGVVKDILVKEGDVVQADQILIRLEGSERLTAAVSAAELELLSAQQALDDLIATSNVARANMQFTLATAKRELDKAQKRLNSKEYRRGDQEQVDTARANYVIAEDAVSKAEEIYDRVDDRAEDDPVRAEALSHLAATRQQRDTALYNLNYLLDRPNELDVAEIDAKLAVAQANVAEAERQLNLMKDGPDMNKLALAQARVKNANASLEAARASLDDLELKAPFAGTITSIDISEGELASPGVSVVRIADFSNWMVETTDLTELNVDRITVGQPAMVRFDALPDVDIVGRVTKIKAFGENRQGDVVYTVVLKLEAPEERLRWNMTASVTFLEKDTTE